MLVVAAFAAWGWVSLRQAPLDAIPDLSDVQVIVFTEWMGQSPDLVEDQVTYPISTALIAAPKVQAVRGQSMFGMSFVNVIFDEGTDIYWARSRVLEYMNSARAKLPEGVNPTLGPDATGVGWVFEVCARRSHGEARSRGAPELAGLERSLRARERARRRGGRERRRLREAVSGERRSEQLVARGVTMEDVVRSVRASNENVGGPRPRNSRARARHSWSRLREEA